jgi:uncharacterized protein
MKIRVLAIDGGGVRGIIPAVVLEHIENKIIEITGNPNVRISDFLDFVSGTSTGSIISAMVVTPNEDGKPAYKMEDVVQAYFDLASVVFKKNFWRDVKTLWGVFGPRYDVKNIDNQLLIKFDHWKMKDLLLPCCFTGYDTDKRKPIIYTNKDQASKYGDFYIKDIVRGSTSIPSAFCPAYFRNGSDVNTIVDGGVFANNPSMVAYTEVAKTEYIKKNKKNEYVTPEHVLFLSFGTGMATLTPYPYKKIKKWGMLRWFFPVLNILLQGVSKVTNYEMDVMFRSHKVSENYARINPPIILGDSSGQNGSLENMKHLHQDAKNYIAANRDFLDNIAQELVNQDKKYKTLLF